MIHQDRDEYMNLLPHQQKFSQGYKNKALLAHEGGTGKTVCASVWLRDGRDSDALIICPKRVVNKWEQELKKWGTKGTVISKENFKKMSIKAWSALVVDEADEFASPLFLKNRSALSTSLYKLVREYDMPTLLLTATPIRSTPWNLHTLLCFMGIYIPWKEWREKFFQLERRPFLSYAAWLPRKNWRTEIRKQLEKHADIVLMRDCVGSMPEFTEEIVYVETPPFINNSEWEPSAAFVAEHKNEQKNKAKKIIEIAKEYRKVLVVAYYREQVQELTKVLARDRSTFTIYGGVKDQESVIQQAQESDECFFIVQASIGSGFDADQFSCVIFASQAYGVQRLVQMKWRTQRIKNLHPVIYYYLIGGRCDEAVKDSVDAGKDFIPSEWNN